jgi:hypothetical protein
MIGLPVNRRTPSRHSNNAAEYGKAGASHFIGKLNLNHFFGVLLS